MSIAMRSLIAIPVLILGLCAAPSQAQRAHGSHWGAGHAWNGGRIHHGGHRGWSGVGIGFGFGWAPGYWGDPWMPGYVIVPPEVIYVSPTTMIEAPLPPEPVISPRNGQSPAQTEADRRDCNRWATTQPSAMADTREFNRAAAACMEGRGYAVH